MVAGGCFDTEHRGESPGPGEFLASGGAACRLIGGVGSSTSLGSGAQQGVGKRFPLPFALFAAALALVVSVGSVALSTERATPAGAATGASLTVTPSSNLIDNQTVSVVLTGASPGSVYVAAECDPTAFTLLSDGESPADACDSRHNAVISVDAGGAAAATMHPQAVLTTALGASDCRARTMLHRRGGAVFDGRFDIAGRGHHVRLDRL